MTDQTNKWDADSIIIHNWPEVYQTKDNKWERIWEITLKESPGNKDDLRDLENELSDKEKAVHFVLNGWELKVKITTIRWGWEDDLYFYNYKVLECINDQLGEINEIQGQKRDLWPPWLWGGKRELKPLHYYLVR